MMFQLTDEQLKIQGAARHLADSEISLRAAEVDRSEEYPWDNVEKLTEARFMGMTIPKDYGGRGLTYMEAVLVIEQIARACGVTARIVVEANMGGIGAIMAYGSDKQKRRCAPYVLAGDKPAICIIEPDAGSAATDMTTTAIKEGDTYIIQWPEALDYGRRRLEGPSDLRPRHGERRVQRDRGFHRGPRRR